VSVSASTSPSAPPSSATSNRFEVYVGSAAFEIALAQAIENCQQRIYSQFMTFEGDPSGMGFAHLIRQKSQAGVDVRLMVDYYSDVVLSDTYPILIHRRGKVQAERDQTLGLLASLEKDGVKVKRTAPPGRWLQYMLYRNHKKMIIIDETTAFVGGINISDHNYHWHDFMVKCLCRGY
jgi:cardiolipin synthase A/B